MTRHPLIVIANWKMNKTTTESLSYIETFLQQDGLEACETKRWFALPFTAMYPAHEKFKGQITIGAQNMNDAQAGAFTGEIAASMIKDAGGSFVILGHCERRKYFHETDDYINKKVLRALESSLIPVLCIGEDYDAREGGKTSDVLEQQLKEGLAGVTSDNFIVAYEPIWAIGTGIAATPELVEKAHAVIRAIMEKISPQFIKVPIVYGGSVTPSSAAVLANVEGVDGFLVGTASLDPETFAKIVQLRSQ